MTVRNIEDQVNYFITKGWAPLGGVVLKGDKLVQTMVHIKIFRALGPSSL